MRPDEVEHVIEDSGAHLVVRAVAGSTAPTARGGGARRSGDVAALFGVGHDGQAQGRRAHPPPIGGVTARAANPTGSSAWRRWWGSAHRPHHGLRRASWAWHLRRDPRLLPAPLPTDRRPDALESRKSSLFIGVPAMYRMMWEAGSSRARPALGPGLISRRRRHAAGPRRRVPQAGRQRAHLPIVGSVGDALFVEGYGMVETGGAAGKARCPRSATALPPPGYQFKVVDERGHDVAVGGEGELWMKGPGVLKGYWGSPRPPPAR